MVQLITGKKGKGKTKVLLDRVNKEVKELDGNVVYLDKNKSHMFELNNKIRLIDVCEYNIENGDQFLGFVTGIISQDHDLQKMYLDCFLNIAAVDEAGAVQVINKLDNISKASNVDFVIGVSIDSDNIPEEIKDKVVEAL